MKTSQSPKPAVKFDLAEVITGKLIEMMDAGICPWRKPWKAIGGVPRNYRGNAYRGVNAILCVLYCMANNWDNPVFLTYKQVAQLGGKVIPGGKGNIIMYCSKVVPKEYKDNPSACPESKKRFMQRYYYVFNIAQTEGVELPDSFQGNANERIPTCEEVISSWKQCPPITYGGATAVYYPSADIVQTPKIEAFDTPEHYYSTLFHELAHSTGHEKRLNRKDAFAGDFGSDPYAFEELVAELTASFMCGHLDIFNVTQQESAAYLQGWNKRFKDDKTLFFRAAALAQKACDYMLTSGEVKDEETEADEA